MKKVIVTIILASCFIPVKAQEIYSINVNRACSAIVGIPYASDNFSDEEWEQFKRCVKFLKSYVSY